MLKFNNFNRFIKKFKNFNRRPFFGFVQGHAHLTDSEVEEMHELVNVPSSKNNANFEQEFAKYLGVKNAVSFASGRMGFYALLQGLGIKSGDEIILTGSTCAVMANAIIRIGAKPIYADISAETFGTCPKSVEKNISNNTKVIVAQHSFGIPCSIKEIVKIASDKGIFLVEDCALSLGSTIDGKKLGLFGDASLFSFDHTKPINAMIGGMICTNANLHLKLKKIQEDSSELPQKKRKLLFKRFKAEKRFCNPEKYSQLQLIDLLEIKIRSIFGLETPFLNNDSNSLNNSRASYCYPAKMPEFIAYLGLIELGRWSQVKEERTILLKNYINVIQNYGFKCEVRTIYGKSGVEIIPLRFVWKCDNGLEIRNKLKEFLHVEQTWFNKPIVDTNEPLENFHYIKGSCPVSETLGNTIINLPTALSKSEVDIFINQLSVLSKKLKE